MIALSRRDLAAIALLLAALHIAERITAGPAALSTGEIAMELPR